MSDRAPFATAAGGGVTFLAAAPAEAGVEMPEVAPGEIYLPDAIGEASAFAIAVMDRASVEFRCKDGTITSRDVGRAAGVSPKEAQRCINRYLHEKEGGTLHPNGTVRVSLNDMVAHPSTMFRAELALIFAERLGIGKFGLARKIDERAAVPKKPKESDVPVSTHPYVTGRGGRSVKPGEHGKQEAVLTCRCGATEMIAFRQIAAVADMDRKFRQKGWAVDPAKCPKCIHPKREDPMTIHKPTPAAITAQAKMFGLLTKHFDTDTGLYAEEWSDGRIAKECELSPEHVAAVRNEALGPLHEPPEITKLASDIDALTTMLVEHDDALKTMRADLHGMKQQLADIRRKYSK